VLATRGLVLRHPEGAAIAVPDADWRGPGFHAITGPTGAGKSSLLLALIGHVPVEQGTLTRDGTPFVPGALNPAIGWAGQSVALVPGTLRDNLVMTDTPLDEAATLILLGRLGLGTMMDRAAGWTRRSIIAAAAFGRGTPPHGARPRHPQRPPHPAAGRTDRRSRCRHRARDPRDPGRSGRAPPCHRRHARRRPHRHGVHMPPLLIDTLLAEAARPQRATLRLAMLAPCWPRRPA
jgi:energy-coupling factor transporter ATP-binding protein EcfA2